MLSIKDYELYSGDSWALSEEDWARIEKIAELRLSRFLCLTELPEPLPDELAQLLANFIAYALDSNANSANIESKTVRNFTIKFNKEAVNAWQQLGQNFADTIDAYSQCASGVDTEFTASICGESMGTPCAGAGGEPYKPTIWGIHKGKTATAGFTEGGILVSKGEKVEEITSIGSDYITDGAITEAKLSAGVKKKFTDETTQRKAEDKKLAEAISAEAKAREQADAKIQTQATANANAIAKEIKDREAADSALDGKTQANTTAINKETKARKDADTALSTAIDKKQNKLIAGDGIELKDKGDTTEISATPQSANLIVDVSANPLDPTRYIATYSSDEIRNARNAGKTVVLYFEDTIENSGSQIYQLFKIDRNGAFFSRNRLNGETNTAREIIIKVDYAKNVTFVDTKIEIPTKAYIDAGDAANLARIKNLEFNIFDAGVAEGENIHITDSALSEAQEVVASVDKEQAQYKGYNLLNLTKFNNADIETVWNGVTYTILEDGKIKMNGLCDSDAALAINIAATGELGAGDYRLYGSKTPEAYIQLRAESDGTELYRNANEAGLTINANSNFKVKNVYIKPQQGFTYKDTILFANLVRGAENKPYEPYVGAKPAPSPDYPQDIPVIGQDFKVKSISKNLFNYKDYIEKASADANLVAAEETYNGKQAFSLKMGDGRTFNYPVLCEENTQYTFQFDVANPNTGTKDLYGFFVYTDGSTTPFLRPSSASASFSHISATTSASKTLAFIRISIYGRQDILYFDTDTIQLAKGASETPYEPYTESALNCELKGEKLYKISDQIKDEYIVRYDPIKKQYWKYIRKFVKKVMTLDGTEPWRGYELKAGAYTLYLGGDISKQARITHFSEIATPDIGVKDGFYAKISGGLIISYPAKDTLQSFKDWLASKKAEGEPVEAVVALDKAPTLIPIAPVAEMLMTYNPITNISSDIENIDKKVKYYRDFIKTIADMQLEDKTLQQHIADNERNITSHETRIAALEGAETIENTPAVLRINTPVTPGSTVTLIDEAIGGLKSNSKYRARIILPHLKTSAVDSALTITGGALSRTYTINGTASGSYDALVSTNGTGIVTLTVRIQATGGQIDVVELRSPNIELTYAGRA